MTPENMKQMLEALLAFALIAGILLALADTKLYGLAIAIVGVALLYVFLQHAKAAEGLASVVKAAGRTLGGNYPKGT